MSQHSDSLGQLTLNIGAGRGRKPKPIANTADRRVSFAFKRDSEIPALIERCSKDREMPVIKLPRVFRKLKESKERATMEVPVIIVSDKEIKIEEKKI